MTVLKTTKTSALKTVTQYETEDGDFKNRSKTYNNVRTDAADEAVFNTYKHITNLLDDIPEECQRISVDILTES